MSSGVTQVHHRRSIRLPRYDYSQAGGYYVTIVSRERVCLFGEIVESEMRLNALGQIVDECWRAIPEHFRNVTLDEFVVMPNHVHGIIFIHENCKPEGRGTIYRAPTATIEQFGKPTPGSLPTIVRTFKAAVTRLAGRQLNLSKIWQSNYYEHIIRDQPDYERITGYILDNPFHWKDDEENPKSNAVK